MKSLWYGEFNIYYYYFIVDVIKTFCLSIENFPIQIVRYVSQVLLKMKRAWQNEAAAPCILPHQYEILEILVDQIDGMDENLARVKDKVGGFFFGKSHCIYFCTSNKSRSYVPNFLSWSKVRIYGWRLIELIWKKREFFRPNWKCQFIGPSCRESTTWLLTTCEFGWRRSKGTWEESWRNTMRGYGKVTSILWIHKFSPSNARKTPSSVRARTAFRREIRESWSATVGKERSRYEFNFYT